MPKTAVVSLLLGIIFFTVSGPVKEPLRGWLLLGGSVSIIIFGLSLTIDLAIRKAKSKWLGKPIPWKDVEEGTPFWVKQEMENNQFLVKFWPEDLRYIVGYPGLYGARGWHAKSGERAISVKDPWPSPV